MGYKHILGFLLGGFLKDPFGYRTSYLMENVFLLLSGHEVMEEGS